MSTITREFTKEQLIAAACSRIDFARQMLRGNPLPLAKRKWEIELSISEIALASLEAEPVAYIFKHPAGRLFWSLTDESNKGQSDVMPVYSAPVTAFVPPAIEPDYEVIKGILPAANPDEYACCIAADMWNACRAAMLQGSEPVTTAYKFPEPIKDHRLNSGAEADDYYSGYQAGWNECLESMQVICEGNPDAK